MFQRGGGIELLICYNLGLKQVFWQAEDTLPHPLSSPHTKDCAPRVFSVVSVEQKGTHLPLIFGDTGDTCGRSGGQEASLKYLT